MLEFRFKKLINEMENYKKMEKEEIIMIMAK